MSQARIVTDSSADLAPETVEELGIVVVPHRLQFGSEVLIDAPSLRTADFHRRMLKSRTLVSAIPPGVQQFASLFAELSKQTNEIVSIHLSAAFNRTSASAHEARAAFLGRCDIHVIDSQFISRALNIIVIEAARAAQAGASGVEVMRLVRGLIPRTYFTFYVESIEPLKRHGLFNVPRNREMLGTMPGVKPLLLLEDGIVTPLQRLHNRGRAVERLFEFAADFAQLRTLTVLHSGLEVGAGELIEQLTTAFPTQRIEDFIYGPVLASYIGNSALGIAAFEA
jgi:DegV family protein with EDD domain